MKSPIKKIKTQLSNSDKAKLAAITNILKDMPAEEMVDNLEEISEFVLSHMDNKTWDPIFLNRMYCVLSIIKKQFLQIERINRHERIVNSLNQN
jgi:hypothetical protein